jgi:hypothetical protein
VIEDYSNFENTRMRFVRPEETALLYPEDAEVVREAALTA